MNRIICGFVIISISSFLFSCKKGFETYSDSLNGFELQIPTGWVFITPSSENVVAAFQKENTDAENPTSIVISAGEIPQSFSAKEFAEKIESIFPTILKNYVKRGTYDVKAGSLDGRMTVYECLINDKKVIKQQAFFTGNNFGYSVIVSFLISDYSDKEKELAETVIKSFRITGTAKK